jgi:hypothetical protein
LASTRLSARFAIAASEHDRLLPGSVRSGDAEDNGRGNSIHP